jgi:hypothetical protein
MSEQDKLYGAIVNIRCDASKYSDVDARIAYKEGHRDARHAAADLVREFSSQDGVSSQYIPNNFTTHRSAWRDAITECINVETAKGNHDQAAYWEHELAAYDRSFARLLDNPEPNNKGLK